MIVQIYLQSTEFCVAEVVMKRKGIIVGEFALIFYVLLCGLALAFLKKSQFGTSAPMSFAYTLSLIFKKISYGTWCFIFQGSLLIILILIIRKISLGYMISLLLALLHGYVIDIFGIFMNLLPDTLTVRILCLMLSVATLTTGIAFAINCKLPVLAVDVFYIKLSDHFKIPFKNVKTVFDCTCTMVSILLSLIVLRSVPSVGPGTIVTALFSGFLAHRISEWLNAKFIFVPYFKCLEKIT